MNASVLGHVLGAILAGYLWRYYRKAFYSWVGLVLAGNVAAALIALQSRQIAMRPLPPPVSPPTAAAGAGQMGPLTRDQMREINVCLAPSGKAEWRICEGERQSLTLAAPLKRPAGPMPTSSLDNSPGGFNPESYRALLEAATRDLPK